MILWRRVRTGSYKGVSGGSEAGAPAVPMLKALLGNPVFQFLVGRSIGLYLVMVGATTRWARVNPEGVAPFWQPGGKVVLCMWHGRFGLAHKTWSFDPGVPEAKMLISQSREGGIVAHTSRAIGAEVIRGSAAKKGGRGKGGVEAMFAMARHMEGGGAIAMTPDGPRGPRMRARVGPVQLAKLAQAPMMPVAWSTKWRIVMDSWDRFILPLPFGSGALVWGNAVAPPGPDASDAEIEAVRLKLEQELNRVSAEADRLAGVAAIAPAPLREAGAPAHAEPAK